MARNTYTAEFKTKFVLEILREEKTVEQIASENHLNPNMLRSWKKDFLEKASSVFESPEKKNKEIEKKEAALERREAKMLRKIGQLTLERDYLQDCFRECGLPIPTLDHKE